MKGKEKTRTITSRLGYANRKLNDLFKELGIGIGKKEIKKFSKENKNKAKDALASTEKFVNFVVEMIYDVVKNRIE